MTMLKIQAVALIICAVAVVAFADNNINVQSYHFNYHGKVGVNPAATPLTAYGRYVQPRHFYPNNRYEYQYENQQLLPNGTRIYNYRRYTNDGAPNLRLEARWPGGGIQYQQGLYINRFGIGGYYVNPNSYLGPVPRVIRPAPTIIWTR